MDTQTESLIYKRADASYARPRRPELTALEQLKNIKMLKAEWARVRPEAVAFELAFWSQETRCGTLACLGGHMRNMPSFAGVVCGTALPIIEETEDFRAIQGGGVAGYLFGDEDMFGAQCSSEEGSAYEAAAARIDKCLSELLTKTGASDA